jgi:hypothetical protein
VFWNASLSIRSGILSIQLRFEKKLGSKLEEFFSVIDADKEYRQPVQIDESDNHFTDMQTKSYALCIQLLSSLQKSK